MNWGLESASEMLNPGTTMSREFRSRERSRLLEVPRADLVSGSWGLSSK